MKTAFIAYIAAGVVFLAIDSVWLSIMADRFYRPLLGDRLMEGFSLAPAAIFYLIYIGGIVFFAILPALASGGLAKAAINGLALGLVAYATYDLTNHATLRDWPVAISVVDIAWGTILTGLSASAGYLAALCLREALTSK
ncbi:putative membrane protein [Pseudochelatococcus lubricantis]|uniref:Membrane protein n=1 Tax=Pseudochelatococcus lubricantis TaxID=1538102 RepID=A0ABX0V7Q4_9HYPH|nr:DUF2177 family protein [Pseudochelatococcus lubricantis]NIJ59136.1 putative membrane protein [Pseudochelatococcus lubricantis]